MIYLPERGIIQPKRWDELSVLEHGMLAFLLDIEGDPMYQRKVR